MGSPRRDRAALTGWATTPSSSTIDGMHNLICGVDESAPARHAAYVAAHYARRAEAGVTLMHVLPPSAGLAGARSARLALGRLADDVADVLGARPTLRIETGTPADALVAAADEDLGDTLIVIGRPRRGRVADLLLGDTHRRLVRQGRHPVMVVPAGAPPPAERADVVVACDMASDRHEAGIAAARVARHLDADLTVVHVQEGPTGWHIHQGERRLVAALRRAGVEHGRIGFLQKQGRTADQLTATARDLAADVLVVDADTRGPWRRLARASVASDLAEGAGRPVIIAPLAGEARAGLEASYVAD
jgi:nucleotide-binding universal stress UspA family protein